MSGELKKLFVVANGDGSFKGQIFHAFVDRANAEAELRKQAGLILLFQEVDSEVQPDEHQTEDGSFQDGQGLDDQEPQAFGSDEDGVSDDDGSDDSQDGEDDGDDSTADSDDNADLDNAVPLSDAEEEDDNNGVGYENQRSRFGQDDEDKGDLL